MIFEDTPTSLSPHEQGPLYADVIVPRHVAKAFTYLVPPALADSIGIGQRVLVPFGHVLIDGAVISLSRHLPIGIKVASLKEIRALASSAEHKAFPATLFELSRKVANYYVAPWGQCLRLVGTGLTPGASAPCRYNATESGRVALKAGQCPDHLRPTLERIARRSTGILSSTLQPSRRGKQTSIIDALMTHGWITTVPLRKTRTDLGIGNELTHPDNSPHGESDEYILFPVAWPDQDSSWADQVGRYLRSNQTKKIVLHAPWPHRFSRLITAIQQAYALNKSVMILCGEIAKANWLKHRIEKSTNLTIRLVQANSGFDQREQLHAHPASIIVGTRSAVFSPLTSVGLIWVEGEEDSALKEPREPRYHAREVACLRAETEHALVVLASAHPSLESKFDTEAEQHTVQPHADLDADIQLVDLRDEPGGTLLSRKLVQAMRDTLTNRAGILLFLNRKGYATALVCQDCGWVPRCTACTVSLSYYREAAILACRYCASTNQVPTCCPSCQSTRLTPLGEGTERAEAEVRRLFPQARIARFDSTTLRRPSSARALWTGIRSGAWDILIGTQALFQGEPLPSQGLVGILQADSGLHVSDFRAAERTYQLMIEATAVARPANAGGRIIVQTRLPMHHAVQALLSRNPDRFYDEEFATRRLLNYPPACHLADLSVSGKDLHLVEQAATEWARYLERTTKDRDAVTVLGPIPARGNRSRGTYQYRILVKGLTHEALRSRIHESVQKMEGHYRQGMVKFGVDIDPVETG